MIFNNQINFSSLFTPHLPLPGLISRIEQSSLVITTIYPIDNETVNADELETLPFSIKIIDTDFKPIDKFNEWIQKDLNIMNAYFEEKQGK